ncbi:hypothetical protein PIB30_091782 [Stylosanthes scabra]|uniref:Uncharacterized protein n=1 Tax=Stylosanthes scabra TaxID=79078 RepID=A0ABU6SV21_9FABA|nr:hypothetical protein [Stylosanthes scabra]
MVEQGSNQKLPQLAPDVFVLKRTRVELNRGWRNWKATWYPELTSNLPLLVALQVSVFGPSEIGILMIDCTTRKAGLSGGFSVVSLLFLAAAKQFGGGYPTAAYNGVAKRFCGVFHNRWHNGRETQNKVAMHFAAG